MRPRFRVAGFAVLVAAATAGARATADTAAPAEEDAEHLFEEARALMADGRYHEACPKLEASLAKDPGIGTEFNLGRCYELEGKLATALATYRHVIEECHAAGQTDREEVARALAASLSPRVPRVVVRVPASQPSVAIRVDGTDVPAARWREGLELDPGVHEVGASAPAFLPWKGSVRLDEEGQTVSLEVPPLVPVLAVEALPSVVPEVAGAALKPSSRRRTQRAIAVALGAGALAGVATGSAFGLRAIALESEADRLCPSACYPAGYSERSSSRSFGDASTATFLVSGALLVAGGLVFFTAP